MLNKHKLIFTFFSLSTFTSSLAAQSFIQYSRPKEGKTQKTKLQPISQEHSAYKIRSDIHPNFDPQNFEWNPRNFETFFPTKPIRMQPRKSLFFETRIGIGFLNYSGLSGNLFPLNVALNERFFIANNYEIERGLSFNPTPLYEYAVGRRITRWFKTGISFHNQGGVVAQTKNLQREFIFSQFSSYLSFNSFQPKAVFELPIAIPMGAFLASLYLGIYGGVVWQSWTQTHLNIRSSPRSLTDNYTYNLYLKPTHVISGAATGDFGFRIQIVRPYYPISFSFGCKFNYWGQAKNIEALDKQGTVKLSLRKPLSIRGIYQVAPPGGVQWAF